VFLTLSFKDNLTDKEEAERRLNRLLRRLRGLFPDFRGVGVWQRQKRGAWHFHAVIPYPVDGSVLHRECLLCGFGSSHNLKRIGRRCRVRLASGEFKEIPVTARGVARYVTRYIGRDVGDEKRVRYVRYWGSGVRKATTDFEFLWNKRHLFMFGKKYIRGWMGSRLPDWSGPYYRGRLDSFGLDTFWLKENFELVARVGFIHKDEEQRVMFLKNRRVAAWVDTFMVADWVPGVGVPDAKAGCVPAPASNQKLFLP